MNYLHLHLSDWSTNENTGGFRLESTTHPELTATQHYSKADIAAIIAVANACHVIVVPEIDMPGHMNAILQAESGLNVGLKDSDGNVSASDIDVSNPNARQLISDLLNECLPLFTNSPYWHLGGDETVNYNGVSSKTGLPLYPQLIPFSRSSWTIP